MVFKRRRELYDGEQLHYGEGTDHHFEQVKRTLRSRKSYVSGYVCVQLDTPLKERHDLEYYSILVNRTVQKEGIYYV